MSYSLDANVLLYASDRSSPRYERAAAFLEERASDPDLLCLAWPTLLSYLRMATHPRIFGAPLSPGEALGNVAALLALPQARPLSEAEGFLDAYREVTDSFPVRGNLVPDAHLATILRQHGVRTLYSNDSDFKRFEFLDLQNPFA